MVMIVGIPKERSAGETRVAATPETVRKMVNKGLGVVVEESAGLTSHFTDADYVSFGARIVDAKNAFDSDIVMKVQQPSIEEIKAMKNGSVLLSFLNMCSDDGTLGRLAEKNINAFALEMVPRLSRAQPLDALSSQSNIAGYRAAIEGAHLYHRFFPMMMTSAGSTPPAKVIVLGAGVAGLQAVATAKRLGAAVEAFDVRPEVKEQVMSLGAKFIELDVGESGEGRGGYAKELSKEGKEKQQALLAEKLKQADIIISTALIPCRPAPLLITEDAVRGMREGSVIIDMAAATGGNCALTVPEKIVVRHGVKIVGFSNYPAMMPGDASSFYAKNIVNLLFLFIGQKNGTTTLKDFHEDEITAAALVTFNGGVCSKGG